MPITFTDWSYGNTISYDYGDELGRWDTNINTMAVGELILNDIILISARNVADIEDQGGSDITFTDAAKSQISLTDKASLDIEMDADYIEFDQVGIPFDGTRSAPVFTDESLSTATFTDWTKL